MKKKVLICISLIIILIIIGIIIFLNMKNENIQINIEKLSEEIFKSESFEDELIKVDSEMVMNNYGFTNEEIKQLISYQGSGATSEEILVLEVNDKSKLNNIKEKINVRLAERKEVFESYLPKEVYKIDNNILSIKGNYVILCVSNDSNKVNDTINNYLKNKN